MKNFNRQILEAINRGIQIALDDFDVEEPISYVSPNKDVINRDDIIKHKIDLMKDVVDLELPSGTLWHKYNLGVNLNQLSKAKNWYGKYYAWGELEGNKTKNNKIYFNQNNYKFGTDCVELTKYCSKPDYGLNGFTDNLTELLPEDDVVYQDKKLHNYKFHIPTEEQLKELLKYTNKYWVNNYDPNKPVHNPKDDGGIQDLNGRIFEGRNGNQLFIPAAGYRDDSSVYGIGSECYVWSSSLDLEYPYGACHLHFDLGNISLQNYYRCRGFSVRPVINL